MINIIDKTQCCGCSACANTCPKGCISMHADVEGFLYPKVDDSRCIKCGLCKKVCPILNKPKSCSILETYAAKHQDDEIKLKSSSGGMFSAIAEIILKKGGVVFGASFDNNWSVVHTYAENLQDLDKLRRSKYVQSDIGKTYQQAKDFLEKGRTILFAGTPCQIAGLRNYLGKEYKNLFTAEIFCHGVPSPAVWQKFLTEDTHKGKIKAIDFRHKRFGWDASFLKIYYKDSSSIPKIPNFLNPILRSKKGFLFRSLYRLPFWISNLYERPSCYKCCFKGLDRMADLSMGDLWGVQETYPKQYDAKGVSVLLVNTPKAQAICKKLSIKKINIDIQKVIKYNPYLIKSVTKHPKRKEFFNRFENEKFSKLVKELSGAKPAWISIPKTILYEFARDLHIIKRK